MSLYNLRKYSFCSWIVNTWNSLPNDIVEAETINTFFKNRLNKHWSNQDVLFNFHADITGIGGLPICMWLFMTRAKRTTCVRHNSLDLIGLRRMSPKWSVFCKVGCNTLTQSAKSFRVVLSLFHYVFVAGCVKYTARPLMLFDIITRWCNRVSQAVVCSSEHQEKDRERESTCCQVCIAGEDEVTLQRWVVLIRH